LRGLLADKKGATAIEYGLIAALIAISAIGGMTALGGGSNGMWSNLSNKVQDSE
jgi:pilus assembly protein Flp/PilA